MYTIESGRGRGRGKSLFSDSEGDNEYAVEGEEDNEEGKDDGEEEVEDNDEMDEAGDNLGCFNKKKLLPIFCSGVAHGGVIFLVESNNGLCVGLISSSFGNES